MSTILNALRRLEEESNRAADSQPGSDEVHTKGSPSPSDDLRERILAEEAAAAALPSEPTLRSLRARRVAFAGAALLAILLIVGGVRWFMTSDGEGSFGPEGSRERIVSVNPMGGAVNSPPIREPAADSIDPSSRAAPTSSVAASDFAAAPPVAGTIAAPEPAAAMAMVQRAPIPASSSATLETAAVVPTPAAAEATQQELRRLVPPQNAIPSRGLIRDKAPIRLPSSAAMPSSVASPTPTPTVASASAAAAEAPPSADQVMRPEIAPALASTSALVARPPSTSIATTAPKTPSKQADRIGSASPSRASSVPPASESLAAESKKSVMSVAEPRTKKLAESRAEESPAVERIDNRGLPDVIVLRTSWHPSADRRSARIRIGLDGEQQTLREGDAVGGLVVQEITPSSVLFRVGEVEIRRKVGEAR